MQSESSIADYTQRIAQTWGVGQKGNNNGAVLFVFVDDHQMFIQTGYGLEGALARCDLFRHHAQRHRAAFQERRLRRRLEAGMTAMMQAVRGEYKGTGRTHERRRRQWRRVADRPDHFPGHRDFHHHIEPPARRRARLWIQRLGRTLHRRIWRRRRLVGRQQLGWRGFSGFSGGGGSFGGGGAGSGW